MTWGKFKQLLPTILTPSLNSPTTAVNAIDNHSHNTLLLFAQYLLKYTVLYSKNNAKMTTDNWLGSLG